jgi:hypothetical protein
VQRGLHAHYPCAQQSCARSGAATVSGITPHARNL